MTESKCNPGEKKNHKAYLDIETKNKSLKKKVPSEKKKRKQIL